VTTPEDSHPSKTRREFCTLACHVASALAVGSLTGCSGGSPTSPSQISAPAAPTVGATVAGRLVSIAIDGVAALSTVGSAALAQTSLGTFLVARTGQDTFSALSAACTHEACTVSGFSSGRFICPCHGSQFTTAGAVVAGPARIPLKSYTAQFTDGVLTFTV